MSQVKQWYIYLLPHGRGFNQPKVGLTTRFSERMWENKGEGLNTAGNRIIDYILTDNKYNAFELEYLWQRYYNCVDGLMAIKGKSNLKLKGKPNLKLKGKPNLKLKGKIHEIISCPHCNATGGKPVMNRWHMDKCKSNK